MDSAYLSALAERVLVFDGAMGTELMGLELDDADFGGSGHRGCNEAVVLFRPELIERIHARYLEAGADVVETDSFTASRLKLDEYGLGERTVELNRRSAEIARRAADRFATAERPRFVAGSLGPTGMLISSSDPALSKITFDELAALYREQATALVEGGVDLLLLETSQDLLEMKAAVAGITRAFRAGVRRVPIQAQATLDVTGRMLLGTDIAAVCATLDALPIDVIGLNCSTGPAHMRDAVRYLVEHSRCYVCVIPNAGLPLMGPKGETIYPERPEEMARELGTFVREYGVNAIGGCCGTTPEHVAAFARVARGMRGRVPVPKPLQYVASAMSATALVQDGSPLLIGERVNAQGSRRIKRLLLAEDYDEIVLVAREQVESGAHVLDVCTALTERSDEAAQMATVVKKLAQSVPAPLMIDSTEPEAIEAALKIYAGRPVVNSINLENGREKLDRVMPLVVEAGAAVVALTIDETGMAKSAERKLEIARRIRDIVVGEYGLPPGALIFDALTFTLATGEAEFRTSALETIEGIRRIKAELPGVLTSLGVSNASFGLKPPARAALNSVMLHHCVQAGLDMAIVNAKELTPYGELDAVERELCDDLVFDRRSDALARLIEHFEGAGPAGAGASDAAAEPVREGPIEQRIPDAIWRRRKDGIEAKIDEALRERDAVAVLNEILLPAMKDVGDRFGSGELILPFVLQSAEVMKKAVAHLEQFLEKKEGVSKGKVVLATVFGDVHDIGKNLVDTILTNNGYTVYDLGKQVPMSVILDKAVEVGADAIGLSALLVSTSKQMPVCVREQQSRGLEFPIIVGGAAINRDFGRRISFAGDRGAERYFEPGVFYAKDAFEGLEIVDVLTGDPDRREAFCSRIRGEAERALAAAAAPPPAAASGRTARARLTPASVPAAPFFGPRVVRDIDPRELWPCFDERSLFRLSWGGANTKGAAWESLVRDEFAPRLRAFQELAEREPLLEPAVAYGYFRAAGEGDDVVLFAAEEPRRETARFRFARQAGGEHLCLADYLRPPDAGGPSDLIALQVVTVGRAVSREIERLQRAGDYSAAYFLHGFSVQAAEALAEWTQGRIRSELGLEPARGKRYSWGYGACPDLSQHALVWQLLDVEAALGAELTEAFQIVPEQSTAAIVIHHPQAAYFNAAAVRELVPA